jgi:formate-dependent nitrite reductase membrane component NrfD
MMKYTPQEEWIRRRGILLWLAFFFIELGAGVFFVSSLLPEQFLGALIGGWLVCAVLGGGLHLAYLGHPSRAWRMLISSGWKTSWISRGMIFVILFLILGLIAICLDAYSRESRALLVATDIFAFLSVVYGGFAMNYVNGIPLWNTALLPVLYLLSGLWGGSEIALGLSLGRSDPTLASSTEEWIRLLLVGLLVLIPVYLMSVRYTSSAGQASIRNILAGPWAATFWIGVALIGMSFPAGVVLASLIAGLDAIPRGLLYGAIICGLAGDLVLRYLILRCGVYSPLIATSDPASSPVH